MVIQVRRDTYRVIRQHDHAVASGTLAHDWVGCDDRPVPLPLEAILGVALHDWAWSDADSWPRHDPATNGILSFLSHPRDERRGFYAAGLDEVERMNPYAALLGSLHYAGFESDESEAFVKGERARQERLRRRLGIGADQEETLRRHRDYLSLFDDLSLFACLTGPASLDAPSWLAAEEIGRTPEGAQLALRWSGDETIMVAPFPFRRAVALAIPCRDLPRTDYEDDAAVRTAWEAAPPILHRVEFVAAG